jgi:hypothetical protein
MKTYYETKEAKEASSSIPSMPLEREHFYNANITLLWTCGGELLKGSFLATLNQKRKNKNFYFPPELHNAINQAAKMDSRWENCEFNTLFPRRRQLAKFPEFDVGYVGNVWSFFTDKIAHLTDFSDFLRQFIHSLPKKSFETLAAASEADRSKAISDVFSGFFGKDATFLTLKEWCKKQNP